MLLFFWYDFKTMINKKTAIAITALLSVGFFAGVLISSKADESIFQTDNIVVGVLDEDKSVYSKMILSFLDGTTFDSYLNVIYEEDEQKLLELINNNSIDIYIIIPADFVQGIININNIPIKVVINYTDASKAILIKNLLDSYEKYIEAVQISCVTLYDIMENDNMIIEDIDAANTTISLELVAAVLDKDSFFNRVKLSDIINIPLINYYGYELVFLIITYISMAYGVRMIKERQAGILLRITSARINTIFYFAGKQLVIQAAFIITFIIAFIIKFFVSGKLDYKGLIFCISTAVVFIAFFTALSTVLNTMKSYLLASNMLIIFSVILGGGIIPVLYLPEMMADIASFMPNYWFIVKMHTIDDSFSFSYIIYSCLLTIIFILFCQLIHERKEGVSIDV